MKRTFVAGVLLSFAFAGSALAREVSPKDFNFAAPVVSATGDLSNDIGAGTIVFDAGANAFYGRNPGGDWLYMGGIGSVVSSNTNQERVERVRVDSVCNGSPCTIASQSGSWVSSVTRSAQGTYSVNFSTAFAAAPTCVCNVNSLASVICSAQSPSTTAVTVATYQPTTTQLLDTAFNVICMGQK